MPEILYTVTLTQEERDYLHDLSHNGQRAAKTMLNALILLAVDRGEYQSQEKKSEKIIAETLNIGLRTINRLKKEFVEEGLEAALVRKPSPPRRVRYDGDAQARLTALACSKAPEGHASWSLRLLADKMVELEYAENISHETVRRLLKKANLSLGKRKNG